MKSLLKLIEQRREQAVQTECWTTTDAAKRAARIDELDELILDYAIIEEATKKLPSIEIKTQLQLIQVPVFKPLNISIQGEYPTLYADMEKPYFLVHFERDAKDATKWNFKKLEK